MTINCTNNRLSVLSSVLSVVGCYALRPKSLSMPYSCRAYTLYGSPALQGWERWIRPHIYWELRYSHKKEKSCGGDSSLHPQDSTLSGQIGCRCTFAYNAFGLTPPSDRLLANDCSWWAALSYQWVRCKDGRIARQKQMCPSNRICRMWLE